MASSAEEFSSASFHPCDDGNDHENLWRSQASFWNMTFSILPAMVVKSALRLRLPDIIARAGPDAALSLQDIAAHLPTQTPNLDALSRILCYLSRVGIFTQSIANDRVGDTSSETRYGLTHLGKSCFVVENNPSSLAPFLLLLTHQALTTAWNHFDACVLEGPNAFEKCHGKDLWPYAESDSDFNQTFNASMEALTRAVMKGILSTYDGFRDVNGISLRLDGPIQIQDTSIVNHHNFF